MNILRELRRTGKKSISARIRLICLFSVVLIINTYAWWSITKKVELNSIQAEVEAWDVAYVIDNSHELDETATFTVDQVYPGMPDYEDFVHIYNIGTASTKIECTIESIKIFGQDVLDELKANNEIVEEGDTVKLFVNDTKYPFYISYTYDRSLTGKYQYGEYVNGVFTDKKDDNGKYGYETDNTSVGTLSFNINWEYEGGQDELDTEMGQKAYEYYKNADGSDGKAIEISIKITSSRT